MRKTKQIFEETVHDEDLKNRGHRVGKTAYSGLIIYKKISPWELFQPLTWDKNYGGTENIFPRNREARRASDDFIGPKRQSGGQAPKKFRILVPGSKE